MIGSKYVHIKMAKVVYKANFGGVWRTDRELQTSRTNPATIAKSLLYQNLKKVFYKVSLANARKSTIRNLNFR